MILLKNKSLSEEELNKYRKKYIRYNIFLDISITIFNLIVFQC